MEQINNQNIVKLTDEQLLNFLFTQHITNNDIYYIQTKVRTYMNEIDASHLIKNKGHKLDMFLGANCQGSNISFDYIYPFFLVAEKYTNNRELWPNRIYSFLNVLDINLSNNDFNGNEWDFATKVNAKEVIIHNVGNLNKSSGYTSFDEILKYI